MGAPNTQGFATSCSKFHWVLPGKDQGQGRGPRGSPLTTGMKGSTGHFAQEGTNPFLTQTLLSYGANWTGKKEETYMSIKRRTDNNGYVNHRIFIQRNILHALRWTPPQDYTMLERQSLQQMLLGKLDKHMWKNEIRVLLNFVHKNKLIVH